MPAKKSIAKSAAKKSAAHEAKIMREKRLALWTGVVFFMTVIVAVWVVTVRRNIASYAPETTGDNAAAGELLDNVTRAFSEVREELGDLREVVGRPPAAPTADTTEIAALQERLNEIEQRLELERFLYRFNDELRQVSAAEN